MMNTNQSGKSSQLELLPPELQCQILRNAPNMQALRALLRASPRYFQVYRTCREMVLSHIAKNQITPTVVPIALDALEMRENRKFRRDRSEPFSSQRIPKEPHEISFRTWERLLRFHEIVDCFIIGFTNSRLVALENSILMQSQLSLPRKSCEKQKIKNTCPSIHSLSQLEYSRLARAFYNLEVYSNLFYDLELVSPWTFFIDTSMKRAIAFLQSLRDWELEELLCVRSYLEGELLDFLNKFENDFMEAYLKDKPYIIWPSLDAPVLNSNLRQNIHLFIDGRMQSDWIESRLTRGIETLSAIFLADTLPAKLGALRYDYSPALDMRIVLQPHPEWEVAEKMKSSQIGFCDDIKQPNEAWFWAMKFCGRPRIFTRPCDINDFRCWGYAIWDNVRLDRLGILINNPSNILATIGTDWLVKRTPMALKERTMKQEEIWSRSRRSERKSSTLTEPRPVFDWNNLWFNNDPSGHGTIGGG